MSLCYLKATVNGEKTVKIGTINYYNSMWKCQFTLFSRRKAVWEKHKFKVPMDGY